MPVSVFGALSRFDTQSLWVGSGTGSQRRESDCPLDGRNFEGVLLATSRPRRNKLRNSRFGDHDAARGDPCGVRETAGTGV